MWRTFSGSRSFIHLFENTYHMVDSVVNSQWQLKLISTDLTPSMDNSEPVLNPTFIFQDFGHNQCIWGQGVTPQGEHNSTQKDINWIHIKGVILCSSLISIC